MRNELPDDYERMINIVRSASKDAVSDALRAFTDGMVGVRSDIAVLLERTENTNKNIENIHTWQNKHMETHDKDRKHSQKMLLGISSFISGVVSLIVGTFIKIIKS